MSQYGTKCSPEPAQKLEILKQFLTKLEDENNLYSWNSPENCNCGNLLQVIGVKKEDINNLLQTWNFPDEIRSEYNNLHPENNYLDGVYFYYFSLYKQQNIQCELTKLPFTEILNQLMSYGFTLQELIDLEHLQDKRFNTNNFYYENKEHLIEYIKNWIKYEEMLQQNNKVLLQQKVSI